MSAFTWIVLGVLVAANALYVAAEFSAVGVRRGTLRERAESGQRRARELLAVVEDTKRLDRHIATCQIGITLSSLLLGAYGQFALTPDLWPLLARVGGMSTAGAVSLAATLVLVGLSIVQVLLGELVPKSVALQFPARTALATYRPVRISSRVLSPFIWILNGSALALLRALRLPPGTHRHVHSPEEIELLVGESRKGGLLDAAEHRRLVAALRLRSVPARDLMVPLDKVFSLPVGADAHEMARRMADAPFTRIPVYAAGPDDIVGFLHAKEVLLGSDGAGLDHLVRPIPRVPASMPSDSLLGVLRSQRAHIAVVEEEGAALGIVTFEDVLAEMLTGPSGHVGDAHRVNQDRSRRTGAAGAP